MKIRIDNKDNPAEKRCFVDAEQLEIAASLLKVFCRLEIPLQIML